MCGVKGSHWHQVFVGQNKSSLVSRFLTNSLRLDFDFFHCVQNLIATTLFVQSHIMKVRSEWLKCFSSGKSFSCKFCMLEFSHCTRT